MITNGDKISVFQNENGSVPGEGVCPTVFLMFLDTYLLEKYAHLEILKESPFKI